MNIAVELVRYERQGETVAIEWERGGVAYQRTVTASKVDSPLKLAAWIVDQSTRAASASLSGYYIITTQPVTVETEQGPVEVERVTAVARDERVQQVLDLITARQARITTDLALLPAATNAQVKEILGRMLQAEDAELTALGRLVRAVRRLV